MIVELDGEVSSGSNEKSRPGMVERSGKKETKDCGEVGNDEKQTERLKRDYRWMRELRY